MRPLAQQNHAENDKPHCEHYVVDYRKQDFVRWVPATGFEPAKTFVRRLVNPLRLPISPRRHPKRQRTRHSFRPKTHTMTASAVPQCQCSETNQIAITILLRELAFTGGRQVATSYELRAFGSLLTL